MKGFFEAGRIRRMEGELPDVLYHASSLCSASLHDVVFALGSLDGVLGGEFAAAGRRLRAGASVEEALSPLRLSPLLSRVVDVLVVASSTGADVSQVLRDMADHAGREFEVRRERAAITTLEKATLLFAGGCVVPLMLGSLMPVVSGMDSGGSLLSVVSESSRVALLENALVGLQLYLVEYAVIASVFVAFQEGALERALLYAAVLVPLSMFLFHAASIGF
ncbi:MAG: type II secretion system F family protein [Candidatus Diapherotrites archaeon]|nr:type II secretion system F family protein [Candidatus Diapherotrites archaeon]